METSHQEEDLFTLVAHVKQNSAQRQKSVRVLPVYCGVPAGSQGEVDDHVHGDQIGHRVVVRPHGAQDPLPCLETGKDKAFQDNLRTVLHALKKKKQTPKTCETFHSQR